MDFINKEKNLPPIYYKLDKFFSYFPSAGSITGIFLYSFIIYTLTVLVKIFCSKPYEDDDDLYDEDIDDIKTLKKRENRMLNDPIFKKTIEENRKKRAIEAIKLLNKIQ